MKMRFAVLGAALVLSAAIVAAMGWNIKKEIIAPLNMPEYNEKSVFELPFLLYSDDFLKFVLENKDELFAPEPSYPDLPDGPSVPSPSDPSQSDPSQTNPSSDPSQGSMPPSGVTDPSGSGTVGTDPAVPPTTDPTTQPAGPTLPPKTDEPNYNFPGEAVPDSWFDNTLFIGNSRTCGLRGNARSGKAQYFCEYGMTVFNVNETKCTDRGYFTDITLTDLLANRKYDKIFLNFGLNESGYYFKNFTFAYQKLYNQIRAAQPDADIIILSIMHVTRGKYALSVGKGEYYHPDNLERMNGYLKSLANNQDTWYIDFNPYITDSEGYMFEVLTNDGYHLTPEGCVRQREWIHKTMGLLGID